jgi:hypothetical protein
MVNRVVDIGPTLKQKIAYIRSCRTMITNMVRSTNDSLAAQGMRIPAFSSGQDAAKDAYIEAAFIERDKQVGAKYGLDYAEEFHYIGPDHSLDDYIRAHAERI